MIDSPIAADSITNKQVTQKESIYHTCRSVLNALNYVDGFEVYMKDINNTTDDPLTKLGHICRQGSSLCYLYNTLRPDSPIQCSDIKPKAYVYHFIIACRDQLKFAEDTLFTVTELFQNDTNKLVKVVSTVKRILDLLESEGIISVHSLEDDETTDTPKDMRANVAREFISTERKYVQDLESLQSYMKEVSSQDILSHDTMHYLFGNLNALVDFQRRFLIKMEEQVAQPPKEQRFGILFIQLEDDFSVYEPFCANFQIAQDLVVQEAPKLQKLSNIMSPTYELPAMLIKPIQRLCKYPLLLNELCKSTPDDWPYLEETKLGLEVIQRITKKVNETKRVQENILLVQDLKKRIVDDNSSNPTLIVDSARQLLLHDKFALQKHDTDHQREMQVYLFEKIILVCKEIKDVNKNSISIKKKRKEGSLVVRGKILLSRIEHVKGSSSQNGSYTLHLSWLDSELQTMLLKCRNEEQLRQWLDAIIDLKKSTTKLDFFSIPQTPRMDSNNPVVHYDDDEDDYYYYNTDNEEKSPVFIKNRSHSYQQQQHRYPEVTSRKNSLSNSSFNSRHFMNGVPGVNLPPLPSSPTINSHSNTPSIHSTDSTLYSYQLSPTTSSHPSSPTTTNRLSSNQSTSYENNVNHILPSGALWQRRQNQKQNAEKEEKTFYQRHVRNRSQSTPIITRPLPTTPVSPYPENKCDTSSSSSTVTTPTTPNTSQSDITKVKIHYFGEIYVVVVPTDIGYIELQKRIESKIKICGEEFAAFGLKYEDEDGDLITISSNEDVQMGFENKGPNNTVNLYIT